MSGKRYYEALFFYHKFFIDVGQNLFFFCPIETYNSAVFQNFARQIALIQYPGRSKHALPLHNKL